ncbi:MAG: VWA domain-containing protein [Planctomycetota bacterium]
MRAAFSSLRGRGVPVIERDLFTGALDTRRLVLAAIGKSRRVFKRRTENAVMGIAVALLLDESGSMSGAKAKATLDVAVMLAEALRGIPQIELEVYSHTTSVEDDRNCLIRQLAGKRMRDHRAIGGYAADHMGSNYDHQAILTVAKLFRQATRFPKRWLLVVSDGQPSGTGYGGVPAIIATRDAVTAVRRQGIRVMNVAVEDYGSDEIYGAPWVLRLTDMPRLVEQFRRLLVRLAHGA